MIARHAEGHVLIPIALGLGGDAFVVSRPFLDQAKTFVERLAILVGHFAQGLDFLENLDALDRFVADGVFQFDQVFLLGEVLFGFGVVQFGLQCLNLARNLDDTRRGIQADGDIFGGNHQRQPDNLERRTDRFQNAARRKRKAQRGQGTG